MVCQGRKEGRRAARSSFGLPRLQLLEPGAEPFERLRLGLRLGAGGVGGQYGFHLRVDGRVHSAALLVRVKPGQGAADAFAEWYDRLKTGHEGLDFAVVEN